MPVGTRINGVEVLEHLKYLGMHLICDRVKLVKIAKSFYKKYLHKIRGKIQMKDERTNKLINSAFFKSLMIYFLTPLVAARAICK